MSTFLDDSNCEEGVIIEDRTDLDFTDDIWNCLIKVSNQRFKPDYKLILRH